MTVPGRQRKKIDPSEMNELKIICSFVCFTAPFVIATYVFVLLLFWGVHP
jgi:hypothetical protein